MSYFSEDTHFDPKKIDPAFLQEEMDYYSSVHSWYAHQAIFENPQVYSNRAAIAYAISETLKAVLCLCLDDNPEMFEFILDKMCPVKRTKSIKTYEFEAHE
jgi:hypothetical protein